MRQVAQAVFSPSPARVWVTIADHYEPFWKTSNPAVAAARVNAWRTHWPEIASRHQDSSGNPPCYVFFYPEEEYRPELLDPLAELVRLKLGDVEVHLHHDKDSEQSFVDRVSRFLENLHSLHGVLRRHGSTTAFGFIHGDWALDNSHPDGAGCGLNNEITLLKQLGCYADFTMPCGTLPMQARLINQIYWATDNPNQPKSYDTGVPVSSASNGATGDLLMIPGPFALRWENRFLPRIEIGELAAHNPSTEARVKRWLDVAPRIGSDLFVKLFSHGAQEANLTYLLLNGGLSATFRFLENLCLRRGLQLHYVSAWQMRQAVDDAVRRSR